MTNKVLFALCSEKQNGKDYIVNVLKKYYSFHDIAFADKLKTITDSIFDWIDSSQAEINNAKEKPIPHILNQNNLSYRESWVTLANAINTIQPNYFIYSANKDILSITDWGYDVVIKDVRTPDEVQYCKDNDIPIVKIIPSEQKEKSDQGAKFESFVNKFQDYDDLYINVFDHDEKRILNHFQKYFKGY